MAVCLPQLLLLQAGISLDVLSLSLQWSCRTMHPSIHSISSPVTDHFHPAPCLSPPPSPSLHQLAALAGSQSRRHVRRHPVFTSSWPSLLLELWWNRKCRQLSAPSTSRLFAFLATLAFARNSIASCAGKMGLPLGQNCGRKVTPIEWAVAEDYTLKILLNTVNS